LILVTFAALVTTAGGSAWAAPKPKAKPFSGKVTHETLAPWQEIRRGSVGLTFSSDGRRWAYWRRASAGMAAVVDGQASDPYQGPVSNEFFFSPDSKHVAYAARDRAGVEKVVVDGKAGPAHTGIMPQSIQFHPAASHVVVYVAWDAGQYVVVVGDQRGQPQFRIKEGRVVFSADGKHSAFLRERKPDQLYAGTMCVLVRDGKETGEDYWLASGENLTMSPDGKRVAFSAKIDNAHPVLLDGQPQGKWSAVERIVFSPDSQRVAYAVRDGTNHRYVVDGQPGPDLQRCAKGSLQFSPDSKHVAWAGQSREGWCVFLDGKPLEAPKGAYGMGTVAFGPKGRRLAAVFDGSRDCGLNIYNVAGGGAPTATYGAGQRPRAVAFSPDGQHLLWATGTTIHWDDQLIGEYKQTLPEWIGFTPDGAPWAIAVKDDNLVRVTARP